MDPTDKCGTAVLGFGEMMKMFGDEDREGIVMEWRVIGMLPDNGAGSCYECRGVLAIQVSRAKVRTW